MANIVKILWSKITGRVPASLIDGQIAINQKDKKLFYLDDAGVVQSFDLDGLSLLQTKLLSAYSIMVNNTNVTANATAFIFKNIAEQAYTGSISWIGSTPPSGVTNHTYSWSQVGKLVTLRLNLNYATQGSALTNCFCVLPADLPNPAEISGFGTAGDVLYYGTGTMSGSQSISTAVATFVNLRKAVSGGGYEIVVSRTNTASKYVCITIEYFTS